MTPPSSSLISAGDLACCLGQPGLVLIDCRHELADPDAGASKYARAHVPGARHAHLDRDLARAPRATEGRHPLPEIPDFVNALRRLGISNDSRVVVYDACGGAMAARLWWMLRWLGHDRVALLDGGIEAWIASGQPLESGSPEPGTGTFEPEAIRDGWVVDTESLIKLLAGDEIVLLDARAPQRFEGLLEPIDPVAGHVPGAVNLPLDSLLQPDGRFVDPATLAVRYAAALGGRPPDTAVAMCGSGVTACHLLLGMDVAGLTMGRLYAGSWSEWVRDPERPTTTG